MVDDDSNKILWAPWRSQYMKILKKSDYKDDCFLCNRRTKHTSDEFMIIERGNFSFVMLNAWPYNPYHLLIAPYEHEGDIANLNKNTTYEIMDFVVKFKNIISKLTSTNNFNVGCNLGSVAGAGIAGHMHMHIVPRWIGDTGFMTLVNDTKVISSSLRQISETLKKHI